MNTSPIPSYLYKMGKAFIFLEDTTLAEDLAIAIAIIQAFSYRDVPNKDLDGSEICEEDRQAIAYLQSIFDNRSNPGNALVLEGKERAETVVTSVRADLIKDLAQQFATAGRDDLSKQILEKADPGIPLYSQFGFHVQASVDNMRTSKPKNLTLSNPRTSKKKNSKKTKKKRRR